MQRVEESTARSSAQTKEERRDAEQQEEVDEAVFMGSFLPRSLNQVVEKDIQELEDGEVEETYAHAVASLTGNQDVVDAVAKRGNRTAIGRTRAVLSFAEPLSERGDEDDSIENSEEEEEEEDNTSNDSEGTSGIEDSESDSEQGLVKKARTPEELEAEREARKADRKANKKAVKDAQSEKRKSKIKKKDKRRAIKKSKSGNRKNK